ncbi:MAG: DUF493 domain-containing protein [Gammaproteobacteria bacterium]|nr:DUF493 domain-containing protein [Gammaproteobacteria bacterium]
MNSNSDAVLEFPCDFPVKAMGLASHDLETIVLDIIRQHAPATTRDAVSKRVSANGKYISVTVTVNAQSRAQLDAIYRALTGHKHIIMAL